MAFFLSAIGNEQQFDANGNPLVGGKINTYAAGTTTPAATYTSNSGATAQANPIVLNALGLPANPIWLNGGTAYKFVFTDANDVVQRTVDNISGTNDPAVASAVDQWVTFTAAPTFVSATSFTLAGDQANTFQVGRRVKSTNTGGTGYHTVTVTDYAAGTNLTTVTVRNDSLVLDSGLSAVSYGLLSATNVSLPNSAAARLALGFTSPVIDRAYAEYTANADLTTVIPADDTIPQNTEGTQVLSVSFTPKSATNRVRLRFQCEGANTLASGIVAAMFSSASANALRATLVSVTTAGASQQLVLEHEYVPGVTTALTFSVRVGGSTGTVRLNGNTAGRLLGGAVAATLVVEEIAV